MDQDRWISSLSIMGLMKGNNKPSDGAIIRPPPDGIAIDRYKSDIEQAEAMRSSMQRRKEQLEANAITESDVHLGLKGLDEAELLKERGDLARALKMSEMAIELLIRFLKSDPSLIPSIERDTVGARVHAALSDAEDMKRQIEERKKFPRRPSKSPESSPPKASASVTKEDSIEYTFESLSAALANKVKRAGKPDPNSLSKQSTSASSKQTTGQSTASSSPSSTGKIMSKQSSRKLSVHKTTTTPSQSTQPPPSSGTNQQTSPRFLNNNDPLVQTIKSDLYVDPSQLQETSWDDIAGLEAAKQALQEAAILPLMRPDLFTGLRKPRNILLYGPPGTGKTMLVRAVAKESRCLLFICTASALTSKWLGEGEKLVRTLFEVARAAAPSIIFVDEMDALLSSRKSDGEHEASRRFKTEFMTQMDGIVKGGNDTGKHLLIIACTNCPWDIDSAVLRRFPRRIYIPLPDPTTRAALLRKLLKKAGKHELTKADFQTVVKRTKGFSGSDIASIASEAAFGPLRSLGGLDAIRGAKANDIRALSLKDFDAAIEQATKSVSLSLLRQYDEWKKQQAAT